MRLARLDLIRYGCFTEQCVKFPNRELDLQLVYGPNAAGKSTALAAIEDLLFGFQQSTPYDFLHDYKDLRIGAVIDNGGDSLSFRRRKGKKDTILDGDDQPQTDAVLMPYLGGADRVFFQRMFSLNHERLRRGGREILDAKDEIGQMLFAAGTGISGLGDELKRLEAEANGLWGPRKGSGRSGRLYYQARESFEQAGSRLKEVTVHARAWKDTKAQLDRVLGEQETESRDFRENSAAQQRIQRIRRVLPKVTEWKGLREEIGGLGSVPDLPEDAASIVERAESDRAVAESKIESHSAQILKAEQQIKDISLDEGLFARAADIVSLDEGRVLVEKDKRDIPNRLAEIDANWKRLRTILAEVGWNGETIEEVEKLLPQRTKLAQVRSVLERKGEIDTLRNAAERNSIRQREEIESLEAQLRCMGEPPDTKELAAVIRYGRDAGDFRSALAEALEEASRATEQIEVKLSALAPWSGEADALRRLPVPGRSRVDEFRQRFEELEAQLKEVRREKDTAEDELQDRRLLKEQIGRDERAVPLETLKQARHHRNLGWMLIRRQYIDKAPVDAEMFEKFGAPDDVPGAFEQSIKKADQLADRRVDGAEGAARIVAVHSKIERLDQQLDRLTSKENTHLREQGKLQQEWAVLWEPVGINPSSPASMLGWLDQRDAVLELVTQRVDGDARAKRLTHEETKAKETVLEAMSKLGTDRDALSEKPLSILLAEANAFERELTTSATRRQGLVEQVRVAKENLKRCKREVKEAGEAVEKWRKQWDGTVRSIGLDPAMSVDEVRTSLDIIEEIRRLAKKILDTQTERIDTMQGDIAVFNERVEAVVAKVAKDLAGEDTTGAVVELRRRLSTENNRKTKKDTVEQQLAGLKETLRGVTEDRDEAVARVKPLLEAAKVSEWETLKRVIADADRLRNLETRLSKTLDTLQQEGDGQSPEELQDECEGANSDLLKGDLDTLSQQISESNERLQAIAARKTEAQTALDKISGGADAAAAEADRQQALTQMGDAAARYIQVRTAAKLLRWAIERYRKEKQAPLLKRAGDHFKVLTLGEYAELTVDYDENEQTHLAGVRPSDAHVGVEGMSDATVDQLYFALRVAAVEEYLESGVALPFVADDLFINYDNDRAAAGFKVLAEFARKTQVLFFTHHQHLMQIAEATLKSPAPPVVSI